MCTLKCGLGDLRAILPQADKRARERHHRPLCHCGNFWNSYGRAKEANPRGEKQRFQSRVERKFLVPVVLPRSSIAKVHILFPLFTTIVFNGKVFCLRFEIKDFDSTSSNDFIGRPLSHIEEFLYLSDECSGEYSVPVSSIRHGYSHIRLNTGFEHAPDDAASIFVKIHHTY